MNSVQLDANKCEKLLGILKESDVLFDRTLVKWYTPSINLEVNNISKLFYYRYHLVHNTKEETLRKELHHLVDI